MSDPLNGPCPVAESCNACSCSSVAHHLCRLLTLSRWRRSHAGQCEISTVFCQSSVTENLDSGTLPVVGHVNFAMHFMSSHLTGAELGVGFGQAIDITDNRKSFLASHISQTDEPFELHVFYRSTNNLDLVSGGRTPTNNAEHRLHLRAYSGGTATHTR